MHRQAGPDTVARIEILEGVRGLLATWVMVGHFIYFLAIPNILKYVLHAPDWQVMTAVNIEDGVAPVALFMIISGFVISHLILTRREKYPAYITRRFLRLFPAFACCLLLGVAVSPMQSALSQLPWGNWDPWVHHQSDLAGLHRDYAFRNILAHLTFMHGFIPRSWWPDATGAFLGVGWSIATEWQFYLIAPFLIFITRKTWGLTVMICLVIFLSPLLPFSKSLEGEFQNESKSLLLFHIQYFFIGGVCYRLWRMWREYLAGPGASRPAPQGLIASAAVIAFFVPNLTLAVWIFLFACLCQIAAAPRYRGAHRSSHRVLRARPIHRADFLLHLSRPLANLHRHAGIHQIPFRSFAPCHLGIVRGFYIACDHRRFDPALLLRRGPCHALGQKIV